MGIAQRIVSASLPFEKGCATLGVVQLTPGSFYWSEDHDLFLNFWFWLHRRGELDDVAVQTHLARSAGVTWTHGYEEARSHPRWPDYVPDWQAWKATEVQRQRDDVRSRTPSEHHAFHQAVAGIGLRPALRVQWVMAPFGERWLVPPDLIVLGADGATFPERRAALLEAGMELHRRVASE